MSDSPGPIVRAEIHPAVGIMRVGSSDEAYLGPELTPLAPTPAGSMRDGAGQLKRQAVRFRVYGYDAHGRVVRELGPDEVAWGVHVANRKAAWYDWVIALDIPEAAGTRCPRRNLTVTGADRDGLVIDAGRVEVAGVSDGPRALAGAFQGTPVALGEARTDEAGRLIVAPGKGVSASPQNTPIFPATKKYPFINADGWYDDVCDGPVSATVTVDGDAVACEPAWVIAAPPNYAPDVISVRTLYDLLFDLYVQAGWLPFPDRVGFHRDVLPILRRFPRLGWVNRAFEVQYGLSGPYPFADPAFVARLADPRAPAAELRRQVANLFRDPDDPSPNQALWPWIYGDAMEVPAGDSPRQNATVSATQYRILQLWAAGEFDADDPVSPPDDLDAVPLEDRPATLTRAALQDALADAFHPGCEVTWPVRHLSMWRAPFRLKHRPADAPQPDYGDTLTVRDALAAFGPLFAQGPGDLSQWMGLPWQADTAFCRAGYDTAYDPYVPTFWPATVPNQVFSEAAYERLMAATTPEERAAAFADRAAWTRFLTQNGSSTGQQMQTMVEIFGSMGVLEQRPGPDGDPFVPAVVQVESLGPDAHTAATEEVAAKALKATPLKGMPHKGKAAAAYVDTRAALGEAPDDAAFGSHAEGKAAPLPVPRR